VATPPPLVTFLVTVIGNMGKVQTGARVDAFVLEEFRSLCQSEGLGIGECVERFMQACIKAGEISGIFGLLAQTNQGQVLANQLKLKRLLVSLEVSVANGNAYEVWNGMRAVEEALPQVDSFELREKAKQLFEAAMSFYRRATIKSQK